MKKIPSISDVIDEISKSISGAQKKQRRIRSGTFWNKFGFERRTKERVDAVRNALKERAITINLEDSLFGSERRSELIVLTHAESKSIKPATKSKSKIQDILPIEDKEIGAPAFESVYKYDQIRARLKHLAKVTQLHNDLTYIFSTLFVEIFWNDTPSYELSGGGIGATRSNWTYHTAIAISQTCKIMNLTCKFEALGKRDAIIETNDESPEVILAAEWEWDYDDIFGDGKELDKLRITCKQNPTSDAFLLFYCPITKYLNHLEKIADYWIRETATGELGPTLFLHTVIFITKGNIREFERLVTVMIHPTGIDVWTGSYL